MQMPNEGLNKLMEECGELITAAAKKIAYPVEPHPDNKGSMNYRLEEEMADVLAAILYTADKLDLNLRRINQRKEIKLARYITWEKEQ